MKMRSPIQRQLGSIVFSHAKTEFFEVPWSSGSYKVLQDLDSDRSNAMEVGNPTSVYADQQIVAVRDVIGERVKVIYAGTVRDTVGVVEIKFWRHRECCQS